MNNLLLILGAILVAVLSALFAVPHFVDWNGYRGVFEEEASRVVGREVRVGGSVNVRLLPTPYVRFEKIRIADATGGSGEPFFRADAFTLWLSVPPLLRGVLEANEIELRRPRLSLGADAEGRGNWTSLRVTAGSLPLVPSGISLQAVRISDGSINVNTAAGTDTELSGIDGELEAEALDGPYKFKGRMLWRGGERQVRVATARAEPDGGMRFKASVTAPQSGNAYLLDGRMSELGSRPRLDGEISGKIGVDAPAAGSVAPTAAASQPAGASQQPFIDFKATIAADLTAARLAQLVLSVENVGQPQLVTGDARAEWGATPAFELALSSRWLDLDKLAGRSPEDQPIETAQSLVAAVLGELPEAGRVDVRFDVEQTTLGGEAVSGLALRLQRETGALAIRELRAGLPGGARLDVAGELTEGAERPELDGGLVVRGSSLSRFLNWAGRNQSLVDGRTDGPFLFRGRLRLGEKVLALTDGAAELNGVPITGEVRYQAGERRRLALRLDGQSVDMAQLWPGAADWLASALAPKAAAEGASTAASQSAPGAPRSTSSAAAPAPPPLDLDIKVRVAELLAGARVLRDVDADLALEKGRLSIPRLRLTTSDGLAVDLEGEVADAASSPHGSLRGLVAADSAAALEGLVKALSEGAGAGAADARIATLVPLRLGGRVSFGERTPSALDIDADGLVKGGRFVASARLDGGWSGWREAHADVALSADSADADQLVRVLLSAAPDAARARTPRRGEVGLKASGVPAQAMLAAASVAAQGMVLSYDGPVTFEKGAASALDGELRITADSVAEALDLAGVSVGAGAAEVPLDGLFHIALRDNVLTLKPRDATVGAQPLSGQLIVAQRGGGRTSTVTASLELGDVRLGDLMLPALDRTSEAVAMAAAAAGPSGGPATAWPEASFDLAPTDRVEGKIDVRFRSLVLADGLSLGPGRMQAVLAPGRIEVTSLDGPALGGTVSARATLARTRGGVDGTVALRMTGLVPAPKAAATPPATQGDGGASGSAPSMGLTLELSGRGTSPRTLVGALAGKGAAELSDLAVSGLDPRAVRTAAADFVTGRIEAGEATLTRALEATAAAGTVAVPPGRFAIEAADGILRAKKVTIATEDGRTDIDTSLDLGELRIDSEWRIDAVPPAALATGAERQPSLPPVHVVYAGPLGTAAAIKPRVSAGTLERELAVRKMEHDVDKLERLRKEDERRRTQEQERLRRLEAERAAANTNPAVAAPQSPTPQSPTLPSPTGPAPDGSTSQATEASPATAASPPASPQAGDRQPIRAVPTPPRPVRRVSPGEEILRQLSPN